jgi:hypothetical protein
LSALIGEPLSQMKRYVGFQRFGFGVRYPTVNRKGEECTTSPQAIVVSCFWELLGPNGPVVSRDDFGPGDQRRDESAMYFYELADSEVLAVTSIVAEADGELTVSLSEGYVLILRRKLPRKQRYSKSAQKLREKLLAEGEIWRYLSDERTERESDRFVVTFSGIEND